MIKSKPGKQFAAASQALCLQVLTDDPGDNTYGHTPLHIQTGDGKRYIVLFAGHPVVIAASGRKVAHGNHLALQIVISAVRQMWIVHGVFALRFHAARGGR